VEAWRWASTKYDVITNLASIFYSFRALVSYSDVILDLASKLEGLSSFLRLRARFGSTRLFV
jgi:hypothetical protein